MLIGQDVLRLLTVKSMRWRTWAGGLVFDSPAQPADLKIEEERAPFIAVYTDDADIDLDGHSLFNGTARAYLTIECAAADKITVPAGDRTHDTPPGARSVTTLAQTDEGLELSIGFLARQAIQALMATDNPWAELWREFTSAGRDRVEVRRGGPGQQAQQTAIRFASRIMRMQLTILADPVYGEGAPAGFWRRFLDLAEPDEELGGVAGLIRAHFETEPGLPSWRLEQKRGTYTHRALEALGVAPPPVVQPDEAEPPDLTEVALDDRGGPPLGPYRIWERVHAQ